VGIIWRLAQGVPARPENIARLTGQSLVTFAVSLDAATHAPHLVAVSSTYHGPAEIVCQGAVCSPEPPHLIWMPAAP
jgi:hypothetical protein